MTGFSYKLSIRRFSMRIRPSLIASIFLGYFKDMYCEESKEVIKNKVGNVIVVLSSCWPNTIHLDPAPAVVKAMHNNSKHTIAQNPVRIRCQCSKRWILKVCKEKFMQQRHFYTVCRDCGSRTSIEFIDGSFKIIFLISCQGICYTLFSWVVP